MSTRLVTLACTLLLTGAAATVATAGEADSWDWTVAPYVWGPSVSGDTSLPDREDGTTVDAGDVLDALEFGALLRVDGTSERWRFLGDFAYLGLGRRTDRGLAEQDFDVTLVELAGGYRANEHVDVLFGVRYWSTSVMIDFDADVLPDVDRSRDWVDPLVGIALHAPLSDTWRFTARGDVGGFDVGSELSWNGEMLFLWDASDRFTLAFGYRHLTLEDTWKGGSETVDLDVALSGPEIGFAFRF